MAAGVSEQRIFIEDGQASEIAALVEPTIDALGYRLVRVQFLGGTDQTLEIMAERPDGSMTIDDCATLSRQLSPLLDVHDPIAGRYRLQVASPGIDRPLVRESDFETWAGQVVKVDLKLPIEGRRRFRGTLEGFIDGEVRIEVDLDKQGRQVLGVDRDMVQDVHLVLTDALIRDSLKRSKSGEPLAAPGDDELPDGAREE